MVALDLRSRTVILASSAGCFLAAVATAPLSARSAPPALPSAVPRAPFATPLPLAPEVAVAARRDPFVAARDEDLGGPQGAPAAPHPAVIASAPIPPIPADGRSPLPPNTGAGNAVAMLGVHDASMGKATGVRAVIVGARPYAIVDDGQTTKLVGIGGTIDGKRVASIGITGVNLAGGEHLALSTYDRGSEMPPDVASTRTAQQRPQIIVLPPGSVVGGVSPQPSASAAAVAAPLAPGSYQPYTQIPPPGDGNPPLQPLPNQFGYGTPSYGQPGYTPPAPAPAPAPSASAGPSFGETF